MEQDSATGPDRAGHRPLWYTPLSFSTQERGLPLRCSPVIGAPGPPGLSSGTALPETQRPGACLPDPQLCRGWVQAPGPVIRRSVSAHCIPQLPCGQQAHSQRSCRRCLYPDASDSRYCSSSHEASSCRSLLSMGTSFYHFRQQKRHRCTTANDGGENQAELEKQDFWGSPQIMLAPMHSLHAPLAVPPLSLGHITLRSHLCSPLSPPPVSLAAVSLNRQDNFPLFVHSDAFFSILPERPAPPAGCRLIVVIVNLSSPNVKKIFCKK